MIEPANLTQELLAHNGHPKAVTQIAIDMSPAYVNGIRENFGNRSGFVRLVSLHPHGSRGQLCRIPTTEGTKLPSFSLLTLSQKAVDKIKGSPRLCSKWLAIIRYPYFNPDFGWVVAATILPRFILP